jgi:uncharacterized protein VirK/YbjX
LHRPYVNRAWKTQQRLEALKQHYGFVQTHFSQEMIKRVYTGPGLTLAEFAAKDVGGFELRLCYSLKEKEGELTVALVRTESQTLVGTVSFAISQYASGEKEMFVGGMQGDKHANKEAVIAITRGLYGMRPKALLVFALQQLTTGWGINHLMAVSNEMHIYQAPRNFRRHNRVTTSYNECWSDCGGRRLADQNFELPATFTPREISTIAPNKRGMYRRRYAMLAELANQIAVRMPVGHALTPAGHENRQCSGGSDSGTVPCNWG